MCCDWMAFPLASQEHNMQVTAHRGITIVSLATRGVDDDFEALICAKLPPIRAGSTGGSGKRFKGVRRPSRIGRVFPS